MKNQLPNLRRVIALSALLFGLSATAQEQAINLAQNKASSASSVWSGTYTAEKAFDGNAATRWSAAKGQTTDQWLQVDLAEPMEFDRVVIIEYEGRINSYQLLVSDDEAQWNVATEGSVVESGEVMLLPAPQKKRYLRLNIISAKKEPSIHELAVYNKIAEVPKPVFGDAMYFEDPRGPLTKSEVDYFKAFVSRPNKFALPVNNIGNQLVYGKQGIGAEALAWMYKTTGDREILDLLIKHCDYMLYCRNDQPGGEKRVIWTERVEKCWPNKSKDEKKELVYYSASENGDILGHIYFCAYLILLTPDLPEQTAPVSDKADAIDFGTTYRDRAMKYIEMCDEVMDEFYVPRFVTDTYTLNWPDCPEWNWLGQAKGYRFPVNQQAMALNAFHKALECYGVLGINQEKQQLYKKVVQASIDGQAESLETIEVDVNGKTVECCRWYYHMAGTNIEDFDHSSYTMLQYYKAYESDLFQHVTLDKMHRFINTVKYIMWDEETRTVSDHVNGAETDLSKRRNNTLPGWIQMSYFDHDFWEYNLKMRGNVAGDVGRMGHFLYMKSRLFGHADNLDAHPINITRYGGYDPTSIEQPTFEKNDISIAGPVGDFLHISIAGGQELKSVRILDLTGRVLLNQPYEESISVAHLSHGIYIVLLETADGQVCALKIAKR